MKIFSPSRIKYLFLLLPLLTILGTIWYLWKPFGSQEGASSLLALKIGENGTLITGVHVIQFDGIETRWTLNAQSATRAGSNHLSIQAPSLKVFRNNGNNLAVASQRGSVDDDTRNITFEGNVEAMDGPKNHLTTQWLRFDPNQRILYTPDAFILKGEQIILEGVGLTLSQETRIFRVSSQVKMVFDEELIMDEAAWGS